MDLAARPAANIGKFRDPAVTAGGEPRATVALTRAETLWFNTGTLCNIACSHCYIESSPANDRLVYLTVPEVERFLDEAEGLGWPLLEAGFTGGEPFLNPEMPGMARAALARGLRVLILTNAMLPMQRPGVKAALLDLQRAYPGQMTLRISLDHFDAARHDEERGAGSFARSLAGMDWLSAEGFAMSVAGRQLWGEPEPELRAGFAALFAARGYPILAADPAQLVIFPEMDAAAEVPEITTACWGILNKRPDSVMCASSRMVVRRRGSDAATVTACTLLPYEAEFDLGPTLAGAAGPVALNHPHCAKFCVLGGASCSG
ncbi:radical SAM protein [Frigidibacter albus]|uniref:Radical SAM protein n=1 Tax=Frigidibacter albus TaxID=1465486 RepID=A0A6L8VKG0_9RHOB|nr:radical SAM protein [Frigidibacter albus]MZQ89859.1 radical SAM protein [Frigidibacter albus]NBE31766.1 radical SAM protein [Frigidibacter albus]GGH56285.1 hypothetical protein GCM10011341_24630 [Frigidibacter albus]